MKLLSERMLAFRDSNGKLGLIDEFCAHRGVSLWFGRNEEGGIRCPYHGWKYDVTGQCIDVPSEPAASGYCNKIKLKSYPLVEQAAWSGSIWGRRNSNRRCPHSSSRRCRRAVVHDQASAGMQLAAGAGRRRRFEPRVVPASRQPQFDPLFKGAQAATSTT